MNRRAVWWALRAVLILIGVLKTSVAQERGGLVSAFPAEARTVLERQRNVLSTVGIDFKTESGGSLPNWDYAPAPRVRTYFDAGRFRREETIPKFEFYNKVIAFDGISIQILASKTITKTVLSEAEHFISYKLIRWPYFDMAGLYAPWSATEIKEFKSVEPVVLHYLEKGYACEVGASARGLFVTFYVADEMAAIQARQEPPSGNAQAVPARKVSFLLAPEYGYAVRELEEWNARGQHVASIKCDKFKRLQAPGDIDLWLPAECVGHYFARPQFFVDDLSDHPVHYVTNRLERISFDRRSEEFSLHRADSPDKRSHLFDRAGETTAASRISPENPDLAVIERIKAQVMKDSQVMEIASWLTDVYGPRLTGSTATRSACNWAVKSMESWGLTNVHLEKWSDKKRAWMNKKTNFRAIEPQAFSLEGFPVEWSVGTPGIVSGPAIRFDPTSFQDMQQRFAGRLKGAFLLMQAPRTPPARFSPQAVRLSDARLREMQKPEPSDDSEQIIERHYVEALTTDSKARHWLWEQGVAALLFSSSGGGARIDSTSGGAWSGGDQLPMLSLSAESYGRLVRIVSKNIDLKLELEIENTLSENAEAFNVVGEIRGIAPEVASEVVMIGAHLDSWTFGTGATDDAAGCSMILEAVRLLRTLDLKPRRTIRIALWTGEEQGAEGSNAYAEKHFGNPDKPTAEESNFSVYFNADGGTGKIRGFFRCNSKVSPLLERWMQPFNEMGVKTASSWDVGGGDDLAFSRFGLPSFGFIQDPIEYTARTHHTSDDVYERLQVEDLEFNSAFIASLLWEAAQHETRMPR